MKSVGSVICLVCTVSVLAAGVSHAQEFTNAGAATTVTQPVRFMGLSTHDIKGYSGLGPSGEKLIFYTQGPDNGDVKITNVLDGAISVNSDDAINGSQLWQLGQDINASLSQGLAANTASGNAAIAGVAGQVAENRIEANAGVASALALGQIRYDDRPGKLSLGLAYGTYQGETGLALGLGYTSNDQQWRFSGGASRGTKGGYYGAAVSATYTFD